MIGGDRTQYTGANPTLMASGLEATQTGALTGSSLSTGGEAAVLARGSSIGRYTVLQMLGAGGMGVVYAAFDPELDRKVAIKLLHVQLAARDGTTGATRLLREAQAMARLSHPNVIAVHDVGTHDGQVFMAMEFVEGQTLGDELGARPRGWREVVGLYVAAGRGLAAAHKSGLVHRDFKPKSRRPSPTAPQPTARPHSHDLGRFERVDVCRGVPRNAGAPQILAKEWQRSGPADDARALTPGMRSLAPRGFFIQRHEAKSGVVDVLIFRQAAVLSPGQVR